MLCASIVSTALIGGCASHLRTGANAREEAAPIGDLPAPRDTDADATVSETEEADDPREPTVSGFALETNDKVRKWIDYFTKIDRDRFQRFLNRGLKYRKLVQDVLIENDLPPELYFLALIESGYRNHAVSSSRAVGVWQFMPGTARRYGLRVDRYVDERRDPIRATEAAAKYLRDLYNIFGSWPLAMAGYNAGEYGVIRSILKGKSRDFWTLAGLGVLPRETVEYVPKLIAAATIGADPSQYGFEVAEASDFPELEAVEVPSPVRISELAKLAGVSLGQLQDLNPHLQRTLTPRNVSSYEVWFPKGPADRLRPRLANLARVRLKEPAISRAIASKDEARTFHRVRPGENVTHIARRYGVSVRHLLKVNSLRADSTLHPGTRLRLTSREYRPVRSIRYRVQHGESLERIARRFGVTVQALKQDNSLQRSRIYPRQVLVIRRNNP